MTQPNEGRVNARAFFEPFLKGKESASGETRAFCPLCEDPGESKTPSASFNFEKGGFACFGECEFKGSFKQLKRAMKENGVEGAGEVRSIGSAKSARGKEKDPLPSDDQLEAWHETLMDDESLLSFLTDERGLTVETIETYLIGYDRAVKRYTIPVRDEHGALVNVRRYRPEASGSDKVIGIKGWNEINCILSPSFMESEWAVLCEGELDSAVTWQHGFPTFSSTSGAGNWNDRLNRLVQDKTIYVCYDVDDGGKQGAQRVGAYLAKTAAKVIIVNLPLTAKGSDLTDYFVKQGYTADDFRALLKEHEAIKPYFERIPKPDKNAAPVEVTLESSMAAEYGRQPLSFQGMIAGKAQPAFILPKAVDFRCSMNWGDRCLSCPMQTRNGTYEAEVAPEDPNLLRMVDTREADRMKLLKGQIAGAPENCPKLQVDARSEWNVEELVFVPPVEDRDATTNLVRRVYNVGEYATPVNTPAKVVGINLPDPKTARSTFQAWACEPTEMDIDRFKMTPEINSALEAFMPADGQTPLQKCREISRDLAANVTRIYGRDLLHMAYDFVYHSALGFDLLGAKVDKGWLEMLVIGDTRTGKSEAALRLSDHYHAGVLKSCEGATLAGLVGGAQQIGQQWMVTWGTIPLNDRRLVVLDEASGLKDRDIIEQMSAIRSSGKAQITKIVSQETSARTRLIWISNPADGRSMSEHSRGGIEAIRGLIRNPEDIARFDLAMAASSADVDSTVINAMHHDAVPHTYTSELCALLVQWAWSRTAEDVEWLPGAESAILSAAEAVGARYVADPPLIQVENVRVKIARLAVAIAMRTFSTDDTGEKVHVAAEHVDAAVRFLDALYKEPSMGYATHSRNVIRDRDRAAENYGATKTYLKNNSDDVYVALQSCLGGPFKVRDFCEFAGMDQHGAQMATRELIGFRMLRRLAKGNIMMEPALIRILKELDEELEEH